MVGWVIHTLSVAGGTSAAERFGVQTFPLNTREVSLYPGGSVRH